MPLSQRITVAALLAAAIAASTSPVMAHINGSSMMVAPATHNYTGNWPVTITHSEFSNGTDCLTLTQGDGNGGSASLMANGQKYPYGSFLVSRGIVVVTITEPLYGQNGALLFIAHTNRGIVGQGIFEDDRGGSDFDTGDLTFGMKGGC